MPTHSRKCGRWRLICATSTHTPRPLAFARAGARRKTSLSTSTGRSGLLPSLSRSRNSLKTGCCSSSRSATTPLRRPRRARCRWGRSKGAEMPGTPSRSRPTESAGTGITPRPPVASSLSRTAQHTGAAEPRSAKDDRMDKHDHSHPGTPGLALSAKANRTREAPISALINLALTTPNLISLAAGLVDPLTLPAEECLAITQRIFSDHKLARKTLQYDTTLGLAPLREATLNHFATLEGKTAASMGLTADDILLTTGSQQALYLIADVLLDPGDIVIAPNPSYFVFTGTLQSLGARVLTVPMDEEGMDVEAVASLLETLDERGELHRVKFVYCVSFFDNPTGLTLSLPRRLR